MPSVCRHCGSSELEKDPARCDVVCTRCGAVLEEGAIVSEVQFEEGDGAGRVIGQFVAADGTNSTHLQGFGGMHYGESRTATLQNGKRHIEELASRLHLSSHFVEIAYNFYKLAVVRRLTRGHRLSHIIAACLYLACRLESTQHMLLDFSDALQADVYALGHEYIYLTTKLAINPPAMDPCIYVSRFAHRLELGDKTHAVSITALRLVSRMKKDWIHTGRRPSGLCGAALLIAARIHGFNRGVDDVIRVVKVCQATVMKRLLEFANTESSNLTVDEFNRVDLEQEEDPPAYTRSKSEQEAKDESEPTTLDLAKYESDLLAVHREIERVLNESEVKRRRFMYRKFGLREGNEFEQAVGECQVQLGDNGDVEEVAGNSKNEVDNQDELDETVAFIENDIDEIMKQEGGAYRLRPTLASLGISTDQSASAQQPVLKEEKMKDEDEIPPNCELDVSDLDDGEIDGYLLKPAEIKVRTILWTKLNAEYLKEMAEKAAKQREEEEERAKNPDLAQHDAKAKAAAKRKRSRKILPQSTPGQAIEVLVQRKKLSSKIDYEKLKSLMPGSTTPVAADSSPAKRPTPEQIEEATPQQLEEPSAKIAPSQSLLAQGLAGDSDEEEMEDEEDDGGADADDFETRGKNMSAASVLAQFSGGSYADDYDS